MRYLSYGKERHPAAHHAAVLIDYENLYALLSEHLDGHASPSNYVTEVVDRLQDHLREEANVLPTAVYAYADFDILGGDASVERALYLRGIEPRYVPTALQANAAELQLCIDAADLVHRRPDLQTFVLVTGNRVHFPLLQFLRRHGRRLCVVAVDFPAAARRHVQSDALLDLSRFAGKAASHGSSGNPSASSADRTPPQKRHENMPEGCTPLSNPIALRTLEVAEGYFGQYEEIYLTPLLRKLSEVLGNEYDPKSLVSELEEAGAVRLEKRSGYPYDYTVLIMHYHHPDVRKVQEVVRERHGAASSFDDEGFSRSDYMDEYARYNQEKSAHEDAFDDEMQKEEQG